MVLESIVMKAGEVLFIRHLPAGRTATFNFLTLDECFCHAIVDSKYSV